MSSDVLTVIPADPSLVPSEDAQRRALDCLKHLLPDAGEFHVSVHSKITFVDGGENLTKIIGPCGHAQDADGDWWESLVRRLEEQDAVVEGMRVRMPCCSREISFTELTFDWAAGFARFELVVWDPNIPRHLTVDELREIGEQMGCDVKQIRARY